jgi:hypothetical protein
MDEFDINILTAMIREITAANGTSCALRITNLIEQAAKLARRYWTESTSHAGLWDLSQPVWRELRESLSRLDRQNTGDSAILQLGAGRPDIDNIAHLALIAARAEDNRRTSLMAVRALYELMADARRQGGETHRAIRIIVGLSPPPEIIQREELPSLFPMSDGPVD